jgi:hypothetical protein
MAYDNTLPVTYKWTAHDFGAGAATNEIRGPAGMTGRVKDILLVDVTETFTDTTLTGKIQVGTVADPDAYAQMDCLVTAAAATASAGAATETATNFILSDTIAADSLVQVKFTSPTGGTPAGIASVIVIIEWF